MKIEPTPGVFEIMANWKSYELQHWLDTTTSASARALFETGAELEKQKGELLSACKSGLKVALAWAIDCNPHFDIKPGESADFDAACQLADIFRSAIANAGGNP